MVNTFRNEIFRPAKTLAMIAIVMLGIMALIGLSFIIFSAVIIAFPDAVLELDTGESMHIGLMLLGLTAVMEIPLRIVTVVFFLIWLHRAFNNLSALKARNLEFSPGWAIGWWFIPFANLVKPFQVVRELYNESDPEFDEETGFLNVSAGTPEVIGFWWAAWLGSNIIYRISDAFFKANEENSSPGFLAAFIVASVLNIAAAGLAIYIIKKITKRQEQRFAKISSRERVELPPPPNFNTVQ